MKHCKPREVFSELKNHNGKIAFIDVRTKAEFKEEYIDGFENIPLDEVEKYADHFCKFDKVYVTCRSGGRSTKAIEKLGEISTELVNLDGGVLAWKAESLPLKVGKVRLPIMRQVLLTAGFLVLLGVVLSVSLNDNFIWLSGFVGAGLMFAGLTGWCGMAKLLGMMPWNK